jgi:hypothetical protein
MPDSERNDSAQPQNKPDTQLPQSGERTLQYEDKPPKGDPNKRIHPRRPLPPVPNPKREEENGDPS